jgi:hypothetical protein
VLIELNVQATSEYARFSLSQFAASTTVKNCLAYRVGKDDVKLIVAVGDEADALHKKAAADLTGDLANLNFVHPFAVEQFAPDSLEAMIRYYFALLMADKRQAHWFRSLYVDRLILHLSIAEYEKLALIQRQEFEYGLQKSFTPKLRDLIVNGGSSLSPEFVRAQRQFERQRATADWVLWILRALGMLGPFWLSLRLWTSFSLTLESVRLLIMLAVGLVCVVLGDWLALTIWGIVMPRFMPRSTLHAVVTKSSLAKVEKTWLGRFLREREPGSTSILL